MAFDFSNISDEELEAMAAQSAPASGFGGAVQSAPQKPLSEWTDEELEAYASEPTSAPAQPAAHSPRMTREERIAANNRAIETARSQEDPGFLSVAGDALAEGAKGAARAVKSIGSGIVGMASGAVRLAGTPVRLATGWEGLHRLADTIDSSYENFGADALMSDYGENPDGFGFAAGRFGEKLAGTAGSLAALGGVGKAVGAAGTALKAAGHAKTAAAVANTLPLMFGNDAAVRAYDTARANGRSKTEAASLAGLNGAIHFLGFKAFENKALNKMLGMPAEMEGLMPKWAGEAAEAGGQSFSSLARGVRNGMIKYTLAERGKGALRAGGIMGLQDMLSDPVMQVAEGASIDDIDFSRMLKAGAEGVGEGALMEGALGAAAVLKSPSEARKFIADKIFRGKDYKVMGSDGKMHDEPGLLNTSEGRMVLMKQNPDATERVLDIVEHGGTPRPAELDAAFLPPDMTAEELKKFASDWRNDLKPYVDEAWAADAPRQTAAPDAAAAEPGRDMLSPEEAQSQQKAANDAAERQKVADRRAAADSMMLDFESWNRLYADGKTDLNFDEWRAAGKPGVIEANLTPKTEEAPTSETRTNEEPAQPEQTEVVAPPAGAEARHVESAEARAEAADARVVEPPAKPAEAAQKPAEAAAGPRTGEDTPVPAEGVEGKESTSAANDKPTMGKVEASIAGPQGYSMSGAIIDQAHIAGIKKLDSEHDIVEVLSPPAVNNSGTMYVDVVERKNGKLFGGTYYVDTAGDAYHPVERGLKGGTKDHLQEWLETRYTPQEREAKLREWEGKPVEAASRVSYAENISPNLTEKPADAARPVSETPKTEAPVTAPVQSGNAAPGISADDFVAAHSTTDAKGRRVANNDIGSQGEIAPPPGYAAKKTKPVKPGDATAALKAVGRNASQDDTRIVLKRVHVEDGQMVATDGRRLVVAPAPEGMADGDYDAIGAPIKPTESYVPYPASWRQVVLDVKRHGYRKIGEIANYDAAHGRIAFADETADKVRRAKGGDLAVLLRVGNAGANPQFIKEVVDTMFALGAERLEVFQAPDYAPVVFKGRNARGEITGVVMPLRVDGKVNVISEKQTQVKLFSDVANAVSAEGAKSASRASDAKSNRLKRADGTDPLAEKPMPKTLQKAVDKISSAIANRTGTGVVTPEEADGIVRGIVESPETKHNRYRDFFNPLENDAKWHESLGLDAESAKNIRDAFDRVKADADLKKWFPQVEAAVKKANDGKLSKKDAVSLFGKISEGLEKAERMGLSEAANRLREAAEVIRPVAETVEQGDVNKFNYSTKGKKLNNRLGGTDKRGGKTVSLDTKNGTVDVGATGQGGALGGNRHLIIDSVNGDELTVTMKDAASKTLATRKMNRAQWSALSQGAVAMDGDPANPQKGDLIRMSRSDATDAPQSWTPETKKSLERVAHVLRNVVTVGGKKVKVEFLNERPESDGPNAFKNSDGVTVGDYANGEIRLYPGATVADVVHEFTHPLVDFARAEAKAGRGELLGKINQIIDAERATWEKPVRDAYKGKSNETILEEIFTHAMGEKGADLFGKSTKTLQGRRWYNRLWEAIKGVWQDFATKMGWNKADLSGLERMSPEDAAQKILSEMAKGRNFGDAATGGEGTAEARRVVLPTAPTTKDIADWLDGKDDVRRKWRRALQDKNIGIRDVEEKLGITDKNESAYYAKDRAFGKNEHELTVLQKQEVEPIVEKIHKSGGDLGLFSAYLYARHAGERNAVLKAERGVDNGSGMNDAQAKTIFDAVDRLGLRAAFEDAAKDVWAMNRKYLQRRVDSGRMTQAEADFLTKRYRHYVPLRTDMTNEELDIFNSTTGGWKRNETMTAEGRKSAADDPLAFSIVQNEQAIRASNANEVRKRWAGVVRRSKGELGEIVDGVNKGTAKWAFTFGDGETVETGSPMKLASERDDIILFKENGQLKAIKMKPGEHGRGIELARAVTDKDVAKFNEHLDWIPRATRWMSAMRTQYVPTFIIRNLKADNLEVMLNALSERGLRGENGKRGGAAFFGKFLKNEVSVAKGVREYFKTGKSSDRYVQEAVENGLLTGGGMAAEGFTETARRLSDTLQALRERPKILGGTLKAAKDTISLLNACAEYNTRMGVYKTLREEGMSVADAVSYARDVTVNFNRKGYLTPYTNAAYMFSNAAIQGMGRAFKSMGSEHGKGVIAGLFMVGVAQALLDDWLGNNDEREREGGPNARNMTEYEKENSVGIALPSGHRIKFQIRSPWSLPMYAGRKAVELVKGWSGGEQVAKDLLNAAGSFVTSPVGGNGFGSKSEALQTFAPTILDPFVQWATGTDYKGEPRLRKSFDKTAPQSWNGKDNTPEIYKMLSQGLNAMTGGNEFRKGWIDVAPEDWQLLTEETLGGVLKDVNNVIKAVGHAVDVARGKPAAQIARDIPFVRDTFTNLPENSNRYYAALEDYERDKAEFKKTTPERRREMKADKPYLFMGKSLLDGQIERVKKYMHLERGEVKVGQKWVEPKTPRTEEQKEEWRKKRLALQAQILERLGK